MKPSVNRMVHYVSHGSPVRADGTQEYPSVCRAAVITEVNETDQVGLMVINPTGLFFRDLSEGGNAYDENKAGGTWHWPERVD